MGIKKLTDAAQIGNLTLKNRIVMAPMGLSFEGGFTREIVEFYKERAAGGASMLIVGCTINTPYEVNPSSMSFTDENKHMLKEMVDYAHQFDCKICLQLMLGTGRIGMPSPIHGVPCSASDIPWLWSPDVKCHGFTIEEIETLKEKYRESVQIGFECGVDAIETHSYGGYLLDQFLTARWNTRTDQYGGDLDGRMRLLLETIDIVNEVSGGKLPVICKITPDHLLPVEGGWRGMEEGLEMSRKLEAYGVAALHICAGCYENWENGMPGNYFQETVPHIHSAEVVRKHVSIPVIAHGRLANVEKARAAVEEGNIDFVGIARGHLADPEIGNKIIAGNINDIAPCISCNEGCIARVCNGAHATCAVNPRCGYETIRNLKKADSPKKVLVVGAGPGGCSAAIYAKQCGHDVEIWEKSTLIGGNALVASMPVFKRDMEALIIYYRHMIDIMGIRVRFLKEATPEAVAEYAPDHLIWAAGGTPIRPKSIPGIDGDNVCTAAEALENLRYVGNKVAVIGGGLVGCEAATHFGLLAKDVSVIEMAPTILQENIFAQSRSMMVKWMDKADLTLYEGSKLVSIQKDSVTVEKDGEKQEIPCDTVVLAMGYRPASDLSEYEKICKVTAIGDAAKPGKIVNATSDAMETVLAL